VIVRADTKELADDFMFGPKSVFAFECTRQDLDTVRLHFVNYNFAVGDEPSKIVRTFYPVEASHITYYDGPASYLKYECSRTGV
jgi:hypothetical protein